MSAHYAVVFRGGDDAYLQVVQLTDFDYSGTESLPGSFLDWLKESSSENHDIYNVNGPAGKPLVRLRWSVLQQSWMAMKRRKQPLWTRSKLLVSSILALAHRQSLALGRTPGKHGAIIEATTKNTTRRKMQLEAVHEKKKEIKQTEHQRQTSRRHLVSWQKYSPSIMENNNCRAKRADDHSQRKEEIKRLKEQLKRNRNRLAKKEGRHESGTKKGGNKRKVWMYISFSSRKHI